MRFPSVTFDRYWHPRLAALLMLTGVLLFARLGERALWSMEVRWGQIPREMLQSGHYLTPTINGKLYYDKPLGSYWLILAATQWTGEMNECAARLPSAVAGFLAVALLVGLARPLFGDRTSLLAGLILATSFSFVGFGRTASADMETIAGELAALALYLRTRRPGALQVLLFWVIMALTSLTKGLLGFALPLLIIAVHGTFSNVEPSKVTRTPLFRFVDRYRWVFHWMTPMAMIVATVIYFTPFALAADRSIADQGLYMVFRENLQRFFHPVNHKGPVYLYGYVIFGLFAPWSALLPAALVHRSPNETWSARRFATVFFWATFVFFTLAASRRSYYLLPILPAASLLVARLLATPPELVRPATNILMRIGTGGMAIAVAGVSAFFLSTRWWNGPPIPFPLAASLGGLAMAGILVFAFIRVGTKWFARLLAVVATLSMGYFYLIALPENEPNRWQKPFAEVVRDKTNGDMANLSLYRTREMVYYLNTPHDLTEFDTEQAVTQAIDSGLVRWILISERDLSLVGRSLSIVARPPIHQWDKNDEPGRQIVLARYDGPVAPRGEK